MKKLFIAMLLPALLAGCSSDNVTNPAIDNNQEEQGEPILFCSGLNQTKAVIEGQFLPTNAAIGIYGLIAEKDATYSGTWSDYTPQTKLVNGKYTALAKVDEVQQLKADVVAKFPADKSLLFFAYYPYTSDVTDGTIPVAIDPAIGQTEDYLYTGAGIGTTATALQRNAVNLMFKHAMARMDIKIKKGDDAKLPATATLKKIEVTYAGSSAGTMSITDGKITPTTADGTSTITASGLSVIVNDATKAEGKEANTNCKFMLFPDGNVSKIVLTMTRSDFEAQGDFEYTIEASTNNIKLEAGKITTVTLTYLPNDVTANSKLTEWTQGTNNSFDAN